MRKRDVIEAIEIKYSGVRARTFAETSSAGNYTLIYIENAPLEIARECCSTAWSFGAQAITRLAVLVCDVKGHYWGMDASHFRPPKATYEKRGAFSRGNPLHKALLATGSGIVDSEGTLCVVHESPAWGPSETRLPVVAV